jgi:iron complex outermembrane receptor protein
MAYVSAKGFETPTFTEMAYQADTTNLVLTLIAKPSTSDTYETGLKSQNQLGDFTLAVFQTKTKMILFQQEAQMVVQPSAMQIKPYVKA